jgi:hypothetical protein
VLEFGGTTTVVFAGGGGLLLLMQPDSTPTVINAAISIFILASTGFGSHPNIESERRFRGRSG